MQIHSLLHDFIQHESHLLTQKAHGAFTAYLNVTFKKPLYTPQVVIVRGKCIKKEGRKLHMIGAFEDKDGNVYAEAKGLWLTAEMDIGRWTTKEQVEEKERERKGRSRL
jgi:acyl-CoA thioesterase FadM